MKKIAALIMLIAVFAFQLPLWHALKALIHIAARALITLTALAINFMAYAGGPILSLGNGLAHSAS
ncbi:hypothetical protein ED28_17935 [[Pantoea] beijingensis]|uniref:Uncharacterized protein n=1 Tax=[Pantoea] beijingensis TaxID=1324864 RepID=A0A443I9B9_9GAMM|nr:MULTISPECIES: hypothetical protein [Erwiniaceae]RWR00738.1 hypothetical protein ED28_17935 [[Pantoea] beijingensis]